MFRQPRKNHPKHLKWVTTLPSLVRGTGRVDPAHIRYPEPLFAKPGVGKAEKPDDMWVVPLHRSEHDVQHSMNERQYWAKQGINPLVIAALLWLNSGDDHAAHIIIKNAKSIGDGS
jgi:hypothetical protein